MEHQGGRRENLLVPLVERPRDASDHWLFVIILHAVLPLSCVALGFWVAALRPRERVAWILLALLLGFSQIFGLTPENMDGSLGSNLALGYKVTCASTWVLWLFALGLYFPEQLEFERRYPWLKWFVLIPLAAIAALGIMYTEAGVTSYAAVARLNAMVPQAAAIAGPIFILIAIAGFFVTIIAKYFVASTPDAKRRLRLLYWGMFLALVPTPLC